MLRSIISLLVFVGCTHCTIQSQELPRRAFLGIRMEPVTDDVRRVMALPEIQGALIQQVFAGSTAESAGLQVGDVLLTVGGTRVTNPNEAVRLVGAYREGEVMDYMIFRRGKEVSARTTIRGYPRESYSDLSVEYGAVTSGSSTLRTIVTRPKNQSGKLPAMLFIQGIGCYTLDAPLDTLRSETQLINSIARAGFVVMRVDKSGMGDSRGPSCNEIDLETELQGYTHAYDALIHRSDVVQERGYIFGHSMGGIMAPSIAKSLPVKGIVVYGTLGVNFMEYFTNTRRIIADAYAMSPADADDYIKTQCQCASFLVSARFDRDEAVRRNPACGEVYDFLLDRDKEFWYQLNDLNIPALWQVYDGHVLALHGSTDYITDRVEHEYIVDVVNALHPGHAEFMELDACDHAMRTAATYQNAMNTPGGFNSIIAERVIDWLQHPGDLTSGKAQTLSDGAHELLWMEGVENAYPRISADGKRILFQSNRSGHWHLYISNVDGSGLQQLTSGEHNNNFADWSADERKIAFVSDRDGNEEIYEMQVDGSGLHRLTHNPARDIHPYFSPDAMQILFNSSRDNAESFEIYAIRTDGSAERRITNTREVETCARLSPDGTQILYLKGVPDGSDDIWVMNADGTNDRNLTQTPQMEGWPAWSPDGRHIVFSSRHNGNYALFTMTNTGEDVRQLTFPAPGYEDARAVYSGHTPSIVFNRQRNGTIGIYQVSVANG